MSRSGGAVHQPILLSISGEHSKRVLEFQGVFEVFSSNDGSNWTSSFPITSILHSTVMLTWTSRLRDKPLKTAFGGS